MNARSEAERERDEALAADSIWCGSTLGWSIVCRCGWRSGITDEQSAEGFFWDHVRDAHPVAVSPSSGTREP